MQLQERPCHNAGATSRSTVLAPSPRSEPTPAGRFRAPEPVSNSPIRTEICHCSRVLAEKRRYRKLDKGGPVLARTFRKPHISGTITRTAVSQLSWTCFFGIFSVFRGDHEDSQEEPSWRSFARC